MGRRNGRALPKVGAAADEFRLLAREIRQYGIDAKLLSMDPFTVRIEVADGKADPHDAVNVVQWIAGLFRKRTD